MDQAFAQGSIGTSTTKLNLGPTHPATHGVFQNILELDGERIVSAEQTIGYVHRAIEKIAERRPLYQITPLTDRLNYCSSPINNMGWHTTCEKLLGIQTPKRVDYLRVIIMELARIADHLICNSIVGVDAGAYTGLFVPDAIPGADLRNLGTGLRLPAYHQYWPYWRV
jgi:NADH-quinone oxidoreductase subunit D